MTHAYDVPAGLLVSKVAAELKRRPGIAPPPWAAFVKTGVHRQRSPTQEDWWYVRTAAVLRKVSLAGPIGSTRLAYQYGGRRDRGSAPYHSRAGSRSIAREILQQLERSGLVQPYRGQGRRISPEGERLLTAAAKELLTDLSKSRPELAKYL